MNWKYLALLSLYVAAGLVVAGVAMGIVGKYFPSLVGGTAAS